MRGVVAAGMVGALEELGLTHAFDTIYGSSAGAICGAYFVAGQTALGVRIFSEDVNNRRFASRSRILMGGNILDLDYLVDEVMVRTKPLNCAAVLAGPTPFAAIATDVQTATSTLLRDFKDSDELLAALRASATMPVVAGSPFPFRGRHYFDASLTEPIPLASADAEGCSHILVLLTRPLGVSRRVSLFDQLVIAPRLRQVSAALADRYLARTAPYAMLQDQIAAGLTSSGRARILGIRPAVTVGKLERRRNKLVAGAASGRAAVLESLGYRARYPLT